MTDRESLEKAEAEWIRPIRQVVVKYLSDREDRVDAESTGCCEGNAAARGPEGGQAQWLGMLGVAEVVERVTELLTEQLRITTANSELNKATDEDKP